MLERTSADAFLSAICSRDFVRLAESLAPSAQARLLLPPGPELQSGREQIARRFEGWFASANEFEVIASTHTPVGRRDRLTWCFRLHRESRPREIIEQITYVDTEPEGIARIDLMCSGFLPDERPSAGAVFDAGTMGCADGLAHEFRQRLAAVAPGGSLTVIVSDPAAKEDLPALIRMMGQSLTSCEVQPDHRIAITVEKRA